NGKCVCAPADVAECSGGVVCVCASYALIFRPTPVLDAGGRVLNETRCWDAAARVTVPMRDKELVHDYRHEIHRQRGVLDAGGRVLNETRCWDAAAKVTVPMRDKELVHDYRFMPEPNLPPLRVNLSNREDSQDVISVPLIQDRIPELPEQTRLNLMRHFNLRPEYAIQLVNEPVLLDYFVEVTSQTRNPTKVANLLLNELLTVLNKRKLDVKDCSITVEQMKELVDLFLDNKISLEICKKLIEELVDLSDGDLSPAKIVEEKNWLLITDYDEIKKSCMDVLDNNPKLVRQYREGKVKVFKALLGIVIKKSQNKLDMSVASKAMEELLK
ncbi:Glutamyl-tRNA(Gln) amidotransferase subunit B, mitochondrial, partial [Operophtera brumata]